MTDELINKLNAETEKVAGVSPEEDVNLVLIVGGNEIGRVDILNKYVQEKRWDAIEQGLKLIEVRNNIEQTESPFDQFNNKEINFTIEVKQV